MTIPPEWAAKYRLVAQKLGPEAGLLDKCCCFCHIGHPLWKGHSVSECDCLGEDPVPPLEVWLYRLVRAAQTIESEWPSKYRDWWGSRMPEFVLLDAMLQALGEWDGNDHTQAA